jgi:hypothetical protein
LRKTLLAALVGMLMLAGVGVAQADKPENPGEKGHCTAFFNGKKKGHGEDGEYPGPFQPLQDRAPDGSDDDDGGGTGGDDSLPEEIANGQLDPNDDPEVPGELADLYDYCESTYGIGGNPDENGRFTTCWTDDDEDPDTHNCDD